MPSAETVKTAEQILKGVTREELLVVIAGLLEDRAFFNRPAAQVLAALAYDALERREAAARDADDGAFGAYAEAEGKLRRSYSLRKSRRVQRTLGAFQSTRASHDRIRSLRSRLFDLAWSESEGV